MTGSDPPQRRVCGAFRVTDRLGSGGFADVWRAVDDDGREVAVKFPNLGAGAANDRDEVVSGFRRAYDALSTFRGGTIPTALVRFLDGRREPPMCLVTELVDGEELSTVVTRSDVSPGMETMRSLGLPVVRALAFLHCNGYSYLDCKPENVLVRPEQRDPVLVDFNTAEPSDVDHQTLFHQDPYKAPEQVPGRVETEPSGPWSDVYGAAKLLTYLLTNVTMDASETPVDGIDVRDYGSAAPAGVADVIRRATRAAHARRPRNCSAMVSELYEADGQDPARATLTDARTETVCPIRAGDTVGRVSEDGPIPTLSLADPERYVSPQQFRVDHDDGVWLLIDTSVNGTFVNAGDGWEFLLSDRGYRHLRDEDHPRVRGGRPDDRHRVSDPAWIVPVDPSYSVQLRFDPSGSGLPSERVG
jgi:serine/threonine protein kinase